MNNKKDCMFQYATDFRGYGGIKIYGDTGLITRKEAVGLWNKYRPQAEKEIEDGARVDLVIWINCESATDYHTRDEEYNYDQVEKESV